MGGGGRGTRHRGRYVSDQWEDVGLDIEVGMCQTSGRGGTWD